MEQLVKKLQAEGVLRTQRVIEAMLANDRKNFVLREYAEEAYLDVPLPIGYGATISQPYTVAFMLELLNVRPGQKIMDIGFGSGWTTALLAYLTGEKGKVFGLEIIPELFEQGRKNLQEFDYQNISLYNQNGWEGLQEIAPFDRILVSAAADEAPRKLTDQLTREGITVIPVGDTVKKITRDKTENYPGFAFVPLVK